MLKLRTTLSVAAVAALLASATSVAKKHETNPELCKLQTVYVTGNSESAVKARKEVTLDTWMKLAPSSAEADAVLAVEERLGTASKVSLGPNSGTKFVVSATLTRKGDTDPIWTGAGESDLDDGLAVSKMLGNLHKDGGWEGGCKYVKPSKGQ
jgi:hypothetical protein